jgi:hypothetical protein
MQLELRSPNMDSLEPPEKTSNIEMLIPKAPGPTLQLPLLHGIFLRNLTTMVPLTASAAASRNTNPYARCYYRSVISGGSPYGGSDQLLDLGYCTFLFISRPKSVDNTGLGASLILIIRRAKVHAY